MRSNVVPCQISRNSWRVSTSVDSCIQDEMGQILLIMVATPASEPISGYTSHAG